MKIVLVIVLYFSVFNVNVLCYFVCALKKGAAPRGTIADLGGGFLPLKTKYKEGKISNRSKAT